MLNKLFAAIIQVFAKFSEGLTKFDAAVKKAGKEFMCTDCLGNLGPRLDCLGTSLQASVSVKMPKVCGHDKVKEVELNSHVMRYRDHCFSADELHFSQTQKNFDFREDNSSFSQQTIIILIVYY